MIRSIICLLFLPLFSFSQKQIYIPNEWQQGGFDYNETRSASSDNFIVYWGPLAGADPTQAPSDISFDPQFILNTAEDLYKFYIDTLHFLDDDSGLLHQYKIILVMLHTWPNYEGWAFGGNYDGVVGAMWMHPHAASSGPTLAHEFTHTLQNYAWMMNPGHGFIESSYVGFFWETHAEFMALQRYPSVALEFDMARWLNTCQFHWSSTRHHYQAFVFLQLIKEKDGISMVNRLWTESVIGEHPLETYMRLKGIDQDQLNDLFGEYAMRNVTWDYEIGDLLKERQSTLNPVFVSHPIFIPTLIDSATQHYAIPNHLAPQDYGYNILRLYPQILPGCSKRMVYINLDGQSILPDTQEAGLRFGFVAVNSNGQPRYSELYKDHKETSFEMNDDEDELYLVVSGAPANHHNYQWEIGFPKIYRFPYEFKLKNAFPEGFQPGYHAPPTGVQGALHPNGGGFVASTAHVAPTAYVGPNALVLNQAQVLDQARIEDDATVEHSAIVKENAILSGRSIAGEDAVVSGNARLSDEAHVFGNSTIYDSASLEDNALIFFTQVHEYATLAGNTFCWGANLHGDIHLAGDAEFFRECDNGTYLQFESAYDRNCDGLDDHPANDDVTTRFISPHFFHYYSLTCDSLIQNVFIIVSNVICQGDTFNYNNQSFTESGYYEFTFPLASGADSIVTLDLQVISPNLALIGDLCKGDTIWFGSFPITEIGDYDLFLDTFTCGLQLNVHLNEIVVDTSITIIGNTMQINEPSTGVQWFDCNTGLPISGANGRFFTPQASGSYRAEFTSLSECHTSTGCRTVLLTGISSISDYLKYQILPNPAADHIDIIFDNTNTGEFEIQLIDLLGNVLIKQKGIKTDKNKLDVKSFPSGTYLVKLIDASGHASMKMFSKM